MKAGIAGVGCVTPFGTDAMELWKKVAAGERVAPTETPNPESNRRYIAAPVPPAFTSHVAKESRLRRASTISSLAVAAGKAAIEASGWELSSARRERLAIVFAVSSGGVQYTRRFYEQVVKQGANMASPMLFPETVYNAPASHLAAMLGVDGATYTLVGDGTIGLQGAAFAAQMLALGDADHVLVVAAEELDWILLEAHRDWRLTTDGVNPGALLAEGAAAVLLSREPTATTLDVRDGRTFLTTKEAYAAIDGALGDLAGPPVDLVVSGGNNTWADAAIHTALAHHFPGEMTPRIDPKLYCGEALGAGALLQVILAVTGLQVLQRQRALVATLGWNQQAAAAIVERSAEQ
jgi:hypothetical protein